MEVKLKWSALHLFFVAIAVLISIRIWSFQLISDKVYDFLELLIEIALILIVVINYGKIRNSILLFSNNIKLFICISIISSFGAAIFHDQSYFFSFLIFRNSFFWLLYYVLHIYDIPKKQIVNLLCYIGIVWALLNIVQQYTYPQYFFYTRGDESGGFLREGIYRFMPNSHLYGTFLIFYFFHKFLINKKFPYLIYIVTGLLGFYFIGTRQYALGIFICLLFSTLTVKGKLKFFSIFFLLCCFWLLVTLGGTFLEGYIKLTTDQLGSDDEIRKVAAYFFLFDYWPHWFSTIIGNGEVHLASPYGEEMKYLQEYYQLYRGDVGIIGGFNAFGVFYVINVILLNIKGLKEKLYTEEDKYLRLIFVFSFTLILLSEYYSVVAGIPFYCLIFYLVDKSYENRKEKFVIKTNSIGKIKAISSITH